MLSIRRLSAALILLFAVMADGAIAASPWSAEGLRPVAERGGSGMSLDQAVQQVRRDTGGRILQAETVQEGGRTVHRIKVLTPDHRVRIIRIPAR